LVDLTCLDPGYLRGIDFGKPPHHAQQKAWTEALIFTARGPNNGRKRKGFMQLDDVDVVACD
jgi:hypothetical protein